MATQKEVLKLLKGATSPEWEEAIKLAVASMSGETASAEEAEELDKTALAEHNEEEDVTLVTEAMSILRELIAREAIDGNQEDIYKLYLIVETLSMLAQLHWEEEWDVMRKEYEDTIAEASMSRKKRKEVDCALVESETASVETNENEGEEDMALSAEDRTALVEATREGVIAGLAPILDAISSQVAATTALANAISETRASAEEVEEAVVEAAEEETEEVVEAVAEVVEDAPTAEAEAETEEVVAEVETETEVVAEVEDELEAAVAEAEAEVEVANSVVSAGVRSYRMDTKEGRKEYLAYVANPNNVNRTPEGGRVPVGKVATAGAETKGSASATLTKEEILEATKSLFQR